MTPEQVYQQDRQRAYNRHDKIQEATAPDKLPDLPLEETRAYYNELYSLRDWLLDSPSGVNRCERRLKELLRAIELKTLTHQSETHHTAEMRRSGWTLFWAIVGGIAGAMATLVLLFHDTPLSKLLPATSFQSGPTPTATVIVSPSPEPTLTPTERRR